MTDWRGRELHFVAIGGAGMSGLALVAHDLGASVTGSDRAGSSYVDRLRAAGLEPRLGHDAAAVPESAEVVVSTAIGDDNPELAVARERGQRVIHRGELLAELCGERRLIAVAGTHGKTTTAGMLAHGLRATGVDAPFLLGGELPGAGPRGAAANAGWGKSEWIVAEADESDGSFLRLRPEVAAITNVELDHHSRWRTRVELLDAFRRFAEPAAGLAIGVEPELDALAAAEPEPAAPAARSAEPVAGALAASTGARRIVRFGAGEPGPPLDLAVPGRHNLLNARAAIAAVELAGLDAEAFAAALAGFPGIRRRLELKGRVDGAAVYDDYAHHPTEVAAALAALRELGPRRLVAVFQPHLYSRTKALAPEFGAALAAADEVGVLEVYPAREEPVGELAGVSGRQVAEAAADRAGGRPVWWLRDADAAIRALRPRLREGDVLVALGAGDIGERLAGPLVDDEGLSPPVSGPLPAGVERGYPLARLTTVRAGGPAELFARPESEEALVELLAWARREGHPVEVVGSGSNLLVADAGVSGLVLKLAGSLAGIARDSSRVVAGGGARLPSVSAKAAGWGLAGIEFGINIPGTVGGAVRMNANAYGGQLARCLEWVDVATGDGATRRRPGELGFAYRSSNLAPGEVVARASFQLAEDDAGAVKERMAGMREQRREAQPSGIKTFGSTFKNPDDPAAEGRTAGQLLEAAGCRGLQVGGARFSPKHANFVENAGGATTAEVVELMAEGRRRVAERFGVLLEPEVQVLGEVSWPEGW